MAATVHLAVERERFNRPAASECAPRQTRVRCAPTQTRRWHERLRLRVNRANARRTNLRVGTEMIDLIVPDSGCPNIARVRIDGTTEGQSKTRAHHRHERA